ncbi:SH3 domain-containing protein [Aquamicrobium zhengzhouense]|uniref:SH3 domain-containing protein n=1 Tax=Aquamicrobium zhengzhouense TaxID=2781738 RepID=A0ABS0SE65_9HYPH|nr:SH3 domain-containing protein [Aquamicrobium zhengzhouense]MBI1620935.1 SH3 domain-containing protein [Aquamicrobium zhengzhouense]
MSRTILIATMAAFAILGLSTFLHPPLVFAQATAVGPSGLPLPRFVSLKSGKVNLRIGPGLNYPVEWMYTKAGVPMEIIQEFDNWRRVRDAEGAEGWINQSLLSGRRTAIAAPWQQGKEAELMLRAGPDTSSRIVARLQPGVIGTIKECDGQWCEMEFSGHRGWISQTQIWGAYPGEVYKD